MESPWFNFRRKKCSGFLLFSRAIIMIRPPVCLFSAEYFEYFAPDFTLHPDVSTRIENQNSRQVWQLNVLLFTRGKKKCCYTNGSVSRLCICSTWSRSVRQFLRIWRCSTTPLASRSMMFPQICLTTNATMSLTQTRGVQKRTTPGQECWCQTVDTLVTLALALAQSAAAHKC